MTGISQGAMKAPCNRPDTSFFYLFYDSFAAANHIIDEVWKSIMIKTQGYAEETLIIK